MEYKSKGYVFDEDVTAWLNKLKTLHGSYNKGLRLVAFPHEGRGRPAIDVDVIDPFAAAHRPRLTTGGPEGAVIQFNVPDEPDVTAFEEEKPAAAQPPPDTRPKNATCKHCGSRFAGPKYATVCNECQAKGHSSTNPGDCPECQLNQGGA